ncbi:MAG: CBS domain-containing protein, partial [Bacteroidetes bacterium]
MAKNTIPVRVADFMKEHLPFSLMKKEDLYAIAEQVLVQYFAAGQTIFEQGQPQLPHFFLIREGTVELKLEEAGQAQLIDRCGEGEVFGVRALMAKDNYTLSAYAAQETLLYAIPTAVFEPFLKNNADISYYLATCFAAGVRSRDGNEKQGRIFIRPPLKTELEQDVIEVQQLPVKDRPLTCSPDTTIQEAALAMSERKVGSIIMIDSSQHPIGIVTYKDLARQAATGQVPITQKVEKIMSSPVHTIGQLRTSAEAQIMMLRFGVHHLVVTVDGTPHSPVQGVVSHHDLLVLQGNSPAVIIREIQRSEKVSQLAALRERAEQLLRKYLHQEVSIAYIAEIMSQVNDAIIERALDLALRERPEPPVDFCWLSLGSEGRKEQLLRTDQDNAIVFADVPQAAYADVQAFFLDLAKTVTASLEVCGFAYCPAEMMASNPRWCLSLS